jgi:hypothetical protein
MRDAFKSSNIIKRGIEIATSSRYNGTPRNDTNYTTFVS